MIFRSDSQRKAMFSRLTGASRLEAELKPMLDPTWRNAVEFDNLYDPELSYQQNKKKALDELSFMFEKKYSVIPEVDYFMAEDRSKVGIGDRLANVIVGLYPEPRVHELVVEGEITPSGEVVIIQPVQRKGFTDSLVDAVVGLYP